MEVMRQKVLFILLSVLLSHFVMAEKRLFTLEDLIRGGNSYDEMSPESRSYWWDGETLVDAAERTRAQEYPMVYTLEYDVYVKTSEEAEPLRVTNDGSRLLVYGESVHRNEFGISTGIFLAPQKDKVAFYRMDQSMVERDDAYPMAGTRSHEVTIGVYDIEKATTTYLKTGEPRDRYFTNLAWNADGTLLYVIELNREQTDSYLAVYDVNSGECVQRLYPEHDDRYTEPQHPIEFLPWDKTRFLMWSRRDGFMHLYLCSTDGKELRQLTKGEWEVMRVLGFCKEKKSVILEGNMVSPIQRNIVSVDIATGECTPLDNGKGWHTGMLSENGTMLLDEWSEPEVPHVYATLNLLTGERQEVLRSKDPWAEYEKPIFRHGTIKAADDSTELHYRMVMPAKISRGEKLPVVLYVYGGPHVHNIDASWQWNSRRWETYMAQKGFVVFVLDNRGSENRGREFEQVTYHRLGQEEMRDQMRGIEFLSTLPFTDMKRVGVFGWSFGGFMTLSLLTNYPDVFKCGVAGGPVTDWKWYEVMYGERYMGTPQNNPEGYALTSLPGKAKNLNAPLQIIIGMKDDVVLPLHALSFLDECIKAGKQPDFFVYPEAKHNVSGHDAVHLYDRITRFFEQYNR